MKDQFVWYVAGPWAHKDAVYETIQKIRAAGWQTCSRWAEPDNQDVAPDDPEHDQKLREQAVRDVEDCVKSDGLIYINSKKSEGKATELGMTIAMLKPIVLIGGRENNIFLNLNIPAYPTIEDALAWLNGEGQFYIEWVQEHQMRHLQTLSMIADIPEVEVEYPSE